jgi:chromosome partitioning protein
MSTTVIAFFNNKGGVGKTSLVYHIAWMFADQGLRVVAVDLDAQGNLSAAFLDEDRLESLWPQNQPGETIYGALRPLIRGVGDVGDPHLERIPAEEIDPKLVLIVGDMALSSFEDSLSEVWPKCLDGDERAFRVISAFWRVMQKGAERHRADVILVDLGPNLGAINRAALIASDFVVIPLGPDLFSLQGLENLGPTLRQWRGGWEERTKKNPDPELPLPSGQMKPIGYIIMQHSVRRDRPVKTYDKWIAKMPSVYRKFVLDSPEANPPVAAADEHCFAMLKHYRSLMPLAQDARKPMFFLKPADGALGAHTYAVQDAYKDFRRLAREIARRSAIQFPQEQPVPG